MEKLKNTKRVTDFGRILESECKRDTNNKTLKFNEKHDSNTNYNECNSTSSRCSFRSSTIAKRARTTVNPSSAGGNKSDKYYGDVKQNSCSERHKSDDQADTETFLRKRESLGKESDNELNPANEASMGNPIFGDSNMSLEVAEQPARGAGSTGGSGSSHSTRSTPEHQKSTWKLMQTKGENVEISRDLKSISHPSPQRSLVVQIKSERKSPASSATPSPETVVLPKNISSSSGGSKARQSKNNRNDSNLDHSSSTTNNNNNNKSSKPVEKTKLAPMMLMNNLPYMGELTFDTRPRRGRKPKKADICHLISKNYGIQFPNSYVNVPASSPSPRVSTHTSSGTTGVSSKSTKNKPSSLPNPSQNNSAESNSHHVNERQKFNSNAISSSTCLPTINWNSNVPPDLLPLASVNPAALLHPKNSSKKISLFPPHSYQQQLQQEQLQQLSRLTSEHYAYDSDEPLNLCVRDKEISHLAHLNLLSTSTLDSSSSQGKASASNLFSNFNLKRTSGSRIVNSQGKNQGHSKRGGNSGNGNSPSLKLSGSTDLVSDDPNLVNINLHLNLSSSKLANCVNNANAHRPMPMESPNLDSPRTSNVAAQPNNGGRGPKGRRKRSAMFAQNNSRTSSNLSPVNSNHMSNNIHQPRQGSPSMNPVTSEANISPFANTSGNAAEVSICKFKFTGGAKPSLQEKKMLSVDSTGNFRFYSDKPCASSSSSKNNNNLHQGNFRDEMVQSGDIVSPHGLPKSAKSMSMCMPVPIPPLSTCSMITDIHSHSPSLPSMISPVDLDCSSSSDGGHSTVMSGHGGLPGHDLAGSVNKLKIKQKRRTRKSLMREKLEKTFKEKGFLIQTQQLESAEGATYCKFRQLRKFTRYLFRSWKDYLPDNLKVINPASQTESGSPGIHPISSDFSESMEQDQGQDETEGGSETPDNMTLSPVGPSQDDENDEDDPEDRDEDIDDT